MKITNFNAVRLMVMIGRFRCHRQTAEALVSREREQLHLPRVTFFKVGQINTNVRQSSLITTKHCKKGRWKRLRGLTRRGQSQMLVAQWCQFKVTENVWKNALLPLFRSLCFFLPRFRPPSCAEQFCF